MNKQKYLFIFLGAMLIFIVAFNTDLLAVDKEFHPKDVNVSQTTDSITVKWGNIGENYKIYLDDKFYTVTNKKTVTINGLNSDQPYEIVIKAFENEEVLDNLSVQTYTAQSNSDKQKKSYEMGQATSTAIFTDHESKIVFEGVPDENQEFTVFRNIDQEIGTIDNKRNFILDQELKPKTSYRYSIIGKVKPNKEEKQKMKDKLKEQKMPPVNLDFEKITKDYEYGRTIMTLEEEKKGVVHAGDDFTNPDDGVEFIYTTFIPMGVFDFGIPFSEYKVFQGDGADRGHDKYAIDNRFRTRTHLRVSFPEGGNSDIKFKPIPHETKAKKKKNQKNWTAKMTDMKDVKVRNKNESYGSASFEVYHNASNPLHDVGIFTAPGITYNYFGKVYRTGSFYLNGNYDLAPSHEMVFTRIPGEVHFDYGKVSDSTMRGLWYQPIANVRDHVLNNPAAFYALFGLQKSWAEDGYWK